VDTATVRRYLNLLHNYARPVKFRRAVSPGVFVAVVFDFIGCFVTGLFERNRARKNDPEAAGLYVDGLHLEGDPAGVINAEQSPAVRLGHPARLRDAADPQTPLRVECQAERAQKARSPKRETGPLVLAVYLFQAGPDDTATEHQLGQEQLTGEGTEFATAVVVGDSVDRLRPAVRHPDSRFAGRLGRVFSLGG